MACFAERDFRLKRLSVADEISSWCVAPDGWISPQKPTYLFFGLVLFMKVRRAL